MTLTKDVQQLIEELRSGFPAKIAVRVTRSRDGGFVASILSIPGAITQADSLSELLDMVNDAVRTYFGVPKKYVSFMPTYLPSAELLRYLDAFPVREVEKQVTLSLPRRAKVAR